MVTLTIIYGGRSAFLAVWGACALLGGSSVSSLLPAGCVAQAARGSLLGQLGLGVSDRVRECVANGVVSDN